MRYFYEMYPIPENRQQVVDDSGEVAIRQQTVDELPEDTIFRIPWGHHVAIINVLLLAILAFYNQPFSSL